MKYQLLFSLGPYRRYSTNRHNSLLIRGEESERLLKSEISSKIFSISFGFRLEGLEMRLQKDAKVRFFETFQDLIGQDHVSDVISSWFQDALVKNEIRKRKGE